MLAFFKKALKITLLLVLWLALSVPLGGMVLAVKNKLGLNIFKDTGYHAFQSCLESEYQKLNAK